MERSTDDSEQPETDYETGIEAQDDVIEGKYLEGTDVKDKIRTAIVSVGLGIGGYALTILWYIPFRAGLEGGWVIPTVSTMLLIEYITLALGAITIGGLYLHYSGRGIEYIDINIEGRKQLVYIIGGILALVAVLFAVSMFTDLFQVEGTQHSVQQSVAADQDLDPRFLFIMMGLSMLVIGPSEEFIFRNLVQKRLYHSFSKASSVIISSLIFSSVHYPAYAVGTITEIVVSLGTIFAISATLGSIYVWSEDLMIVSLIHGVYNASIFGQWYLQLAGIPSII